MPDNENASTEVLTEIAPTQRILKILKSEELPIPQDREKDHLYYVYDKMRLFLYQSVYTDPFSIVEKIPEQEVLVENMLYIVLETGYMYTYSHGSIIQLGHIEINEFGDVDPDQLDLLKTVGTVYFMNAESRYLDAQTRTIQLPFQNGSYQLTLSLAKDLMIDKETIISYNQDTEQFEIMGAEFQPDKWLRDIYKYRGNWNETVITSIEPGSNAIKSKVNVADISGNAIQILGKGLYVDASSFAKAERYNDMVLAFVNYKNIIDRYVTECTEAIMTITASISNQTIREKIMDVLEEYKPTIEEMFAKYDEYYEALGEIEYAIENELPKKVQAAEDEIVDYIDSKDNSWSYFPQDADPAEVLTPDQIAAQGLLVSEYRNAVLYMRSIEPPEPKPTPEPTPEPEPETPEEPEVLGDGEDDTPIDNSDSTGGIDDNPDTSEDDPSEDDPVDPPIDPEPDPEPEEETGGLVVNSHGYREDEQDISDMIISEYMKLVATENVVEPDPDPEDPEETDPTEEENP